MARIEEREEGGWKFLLRETSFPQKRLLNFIPKKFLPIRSKSTPKVRRSRIPKTGWSCARPQHTKLGGVESPKLGGVVRDSTDEKFYAMKFGVAREMVGAHAALATSAPGRETNVGCAAPTCAHNPRSRRRRIEGSHEAPGTLHGCKGQHLFPTHTTLGFA